MTRPHYKYTCQGEGYSDSLGPDPYTVMPGYKMMPHYECRLCGEKFPQDQLKEASRYNYAIGAYDDPKPICFDCAKLVSTYDWRVW